MGFVPSRLVPIQDLQPGDWVYAHDGLPHQVTRTLRRRYRGVMVGLRHAHSPETLWLTEDHLVLANRRVRRLGERGEWRDVPRESFGRARRLRREMSPPERMLWSRLRVGQCGAQFRRQHPLGPFIADFYARQAGLVVEVDGADHFETQAARLRDRGRDTFMRARGLRVLRFTAAEVSRNLEGVTATIYEATRESTLPEDRRKQWRRAGDLRVGDTVFTGPDLRPGRVTTLDKQECEEYVYDLEVEGVHSFLTEICAIHNCGCGTTIAVAERLHRRWIGIDITHLAIALMKTRLDHAFGPDLTPYDVIGEPKDLESARALFRQDPYQFQYWALSLVKARPAGEPKKGADKGIDGWQYFFDDDSGQAKRIVIEVKGGHATVSQVGYLIAAAQREKADLGVFLTLEPSTKPMRDMAADAGMYQAPGLQEAVPRIQILTIEELLGGKTIQLPPTANATFKRAPRQFKAKPKAGQRGLPEA